jgi:hypothetical protein
VNDLALKIDQIHSSVFHEMRRKECKPRERALSFASAQANTSAFEGILLDGGYDRAGDEDRARTDSGRAGEHRATL